MKLNELLFFNRISTKDKAFFMRQMAVMISSGVSIANALHLLSQQNENKKLKQMLAVMAQDVENGHPLSVTAARFPELFDPISLAMLKSGEATGQLQLIVTDMADHVENNIRFSGKIRNAMIYPAFVVLVMIVVGIIMTTFIIPKITEVIENDNNTLQLPWMTQVVMGISGFIIRFWYLLIIGLVFAIIGLRAYLITPSGKESLYALQMKIPVVKTLVANTYLTRFTSVLCMLIKAGVPFTEALRIVAETMGSSVWVRSTQIVRSEVERGIPLSAALSRHSVFPPALTQMVAVGEQTGKLDQVLENMARFYEEQTDLSLKAVTAMIEPVILIVVAIAVAFVVIAVIMPIYGLAEQF